MRVSTVPLIWTIFLVQNKEKELLIGIEFIFQSRVEQWDNFFNYNFFSGLEKMNEIVN